MGANKDCEQIKQVYIHKKGKGTNGGSNNARFSPNGRNGATSLMALSSTLISMIIMQISLGSIYLLLLS
ncbi:hypothetical protein AQUCO_01800187v1 [Aquilegia coerulea]|uniref:Uncharacterized protein n=1 Tax=Aquilegia coerulea TaxID=218851 RepID=A0A2G5DKD2_AQUCA|nr:hypothetical protein AQUCO_01800187v1 [Aquilegia coerulea]